MNECSFFIIPLYTLSSLFQNKKGLPQGGYVIGDQPWTAPSGSTYPAAGNIDLKQGTFEAWVRPHFNPQPVFDPNDPARGQLNRSLFQVDLGGGERQRVGIARALIRKSAVLLMDEPISHLDADLRARTRGELARLQRVLGINFEQLVALGQRPLDLLAEQRAVRQARQRVVVGEMR